VRAVESNRKKLKGLIAHINRKAWWHVPPRDPKAYQKRGKFYSSSFAEAEFWGRPLDQPARVQISKPLIGDERSIERRLFGRLISASAPDEPVIEWRFRLDSKMKRTALAKGYDSIVLMTPPAFVAYRRIGKLPRSIELNVLRPA
jgi:hypothetical protein